MWIATSFITPNTADFRSKTRDLVQLHYRARIYIEFYESDNENCVYIISVYL